MGLSLVAADANAIVIIVGVAVVICAGEVIPIGFFSALHLKTVFIPDGLNVNIVIAGSGKISVVNPGVGILR